MLRVVCATSARCTNGGAGVSPANPHAGGTPAPPTKSPMPDTTFWNNVARNYDRWYASRFGAYADRQERRLFLRMCRPQTGERVLDVGCGTGRNMDWFRQLGLEALGVDSSPAMLQIARERLAGSGEEGGLAADGMSLPFPDSAFDLVTALNVLCFVPHPDRLITEMLRISRDRIFLGVLNRHSPYYVQQRLRRARSLRRYICIRWASLFGSCAAPCRSLKVFAEGVRGKPLSSERGFPAMPFSPVAVTPPSLPTPPASHPRGCPGCSTRTPCSWASWP